jgi:hypothetical protein
MKTCLVGHTGFVGQNLALSYPYNGLYNSKNIDDAYDSCPDLLVYAGVTGTKYIANHEPEKDLAAKRVALYNIRRINPKRLVLISTVDVYRNPVSVNEDTPSSPENMQPYGYTRMMLEKWVRDEYPDALFVRLPGLYGAGLKKNFVYDLIHLVPPMLSDAKRCELLSNDGFIMPYYQNLGNGFWKLNCGDGEDFLALRDYFEHISFNALHYTDSRGVYQYYPLSRLHRHIKTALEAGLTVANIATEPFEIGEMVAYIDGELFINQLDQPVVHYDVRTRYNHVFGGRDGYILSKREVLDDLKAYVQEERARLQTAVEEPARQVVSKL